MTRKRGLTLGKFAPLHKGHQLLIETALSEMDEVLAIIYDCYSPQSCSELLWVLS
jgi:HTH-type transcriptional repressor of NAD biosynthesis genes